MQTRPVGVPADGHPLAVPHRSGFLESLAAQGYAVRTVKSFRLMVSRMCAEAQARSLEPHTLDANVMRKLADASPRTGTSYMERELAMATRRFTAYLVDVGAIAPATPTPPPPGSPEQLCAELDHWLRSHQGMFGSRLKVYRNVMQRLIGFCCTTTGTVEDLAAITPEAVSAFLDGYAGRAGWRLPYVRNILRFLFWSRRTPRDLSDAIPRAPGGRPDGLPRHLEASVVHKLLEAVRGDCAIDLRDHAMLLLMARLGLRAQDVVRIRLDDIDWGAGQMLVRGKGRQFDRVPIPVDVGEAIVTWLCNGRKGGNSRHVFVCVRPLYPAHTNGIESFWAMLKRAHTGTYHKLSPKHLNRYVQEFAGKHNVRGSDTLAQMATVVAGLIGKRLMYRDLVAPNGLCLFDTGKAFPHAPQVCMNFLS